MINQGHRGANQQNISGSSLNYVGDYRIPVNFFYPDFSLSRTSSHLVQAEPNRQLYSPPIDMDGHDQDFPKHLPQIQWHYRVKFNCSYKQIKR